MIRALFLLIAMLGITACAGLSSSASTKGLDINEVVVVNDLGYDVDDVKIRVEKTRGVFACSVILAKQFCANKFRQRPYEQNGITVSWRAQGQSHSTGLIRVPAPEGVQQGVFKAVLRVNEGGKYRAYLEEK